MNCSWYSSLQIRCRLDCSVPFPDSRQRVGCLICGRRKPPPFLNFYVLRFEPFQFLNRSIWDGIQFSSGGFLIKKKTWSRQESLDIFKMRLSIVFFPSVFPLPGPLFIISFFLSLWSFHSRFWTTVDWSRTSFTSDGINLAIGNIPRTGITFSCNPMFVRRTLRRSISSEDANWALE